MRADGLEIVVRSFKFGLAWKVESKLVLIFEF